MPSVALQPEERPVVAADEEDVDVPVLLPVLLVVLLGEEVCV